jgi:hypothetical protein
MLLRDLRVDRHRTGALSSHGLTRFLLGQGSPNFSHAIEFANERSAAG